MPLRQGGATQAPSEASGSTHGPGLCCCCCHPLSCGHRQAGSACVKRVLRCLRQPRLQGRRQAASAAITGCCELLDCTPAASRLARGAGWLRGAPAHLGRHHLPPLRRRLLNGSRAHLRAAVAALDHARGRAELCAPAPGAPAATGTRHAHRLQRGLQWLLHSLLQPCLVLCDTPRARDGKEFARAARQAKGPDTATAAHEALRLDLSMAVLCALQRRRDRRRGAMCVRAHISARRVRWRGGATAGVILQQVHLLVC